MNPVIVNNDILFAINDNHYPLAISSIGTNRIQEKIIRPNGHPRYHWLQTEEGIGEIQIDDQKILLPPNTGIFLPPFTPHNYHKIDDADWYTSFFTLEGKLAYIIDQIVEIKIQAIPIDELPSLFLAVASDNQIELTNIDNIDVAKPIFDFLISMNKFFAANSTNEHPLYLEYIAPVINYMQKNLNNKIYLADLANVVHITPQYLIRLFKRFTAKSPYQYLSLLRIARAKELLVDHPDLSVKLIGEQVGFVDTSLFIKQFKQMTETTPSEFRRIN